MDGLRTVTKRRSPGAKDWIMSTHWAVDGAPERLVLSDQRADAFFKVTNLGQEAGRAMLEVVPGDGAESSWFRVDDPQRAVPAAGSVAFLVDVTVPEDTPAGSYSLRATVHSADAAPDETAATSGQITFELGSAPRPVAKPKPWLLVSVAGLVVLVLALVAWLVAARADRAVPTANAGSPTRAASTGSPTSGTTAASPTPPQTANVPNLVSLTIEEATADLTKVGLAVGTIKHRHYPAQAGRVLAQGTAALESVPTSSMVDLEVAVDLSAPTIASPARAASFPRNSAVQVLWSQPEAWVSTWQVRAEKQNCYYYIGHEYRDCRWDLQAAATQTAAAYASSFQLAFQPLLNLGYYNTGVVRVIVTAVDDFGTAGTSATIEYRFN
jgi:hypothetical protein